MTPLTCLIPAWNEAARLPAVLAAVTRHPLVARVLVVDDGSTDRTPEVALACGAEVLALPQNCGKTAALAEGIAALEGEHALLLDADLTGLTAGDVTRLALPVLTGRADASLSLRGNAPGLWQILGVDYISGERVLPVALLRELAPMLPNLPHFGFEVYLNRALKARGARVTVVDWPWVSSPSKAAKQGFRRGLLSDVAMIRDILRCQ
ncbi:MAG: glycosyltransferase family 2 protein, partial [Pararhodobacter sp.]